MELTALTDGARDRRAIEATVRTIAAGADLHQWAAVRSAFADEVDVDYGMPEHLDADELIRRWREFLPGFDATRHELSDIVLWPNGERG